jgi:hypothetical protein
VIGFLLAWTGVAVLAAPALGFFLRRAGEIAEEPTELVPPSA